MEKLLMSLFAPPPAFTGFAIGYVNGSGRALRHRTRAPMRPRFGVDSSVFVTRVIDHVVVDLPRGARTGLVVEPVEPLLTAA